MSNNNITINCLIVPIGKLMNIPCVKVMQAITVEKDECYSFLEAIIQSRLGVDIPLKICIIQAESNNEKVMMRVIIFPIILLRSLKQSTSISLYTPGQNNL